MALPTLSVLLDDSTNTFPYNVTSRVMAIDGYSVSRGRSDWQGAVTAGELQITFNNSDGFFTAEGGGPFGSGPFGGSVFGDRRVFVDQPIRLTETVNGVTYTRFTGFVKSWPVSWPAVVATFSTALPAATDAQARAERTTLRSMLEEEILLNSPTTYYTLGEAEGSTTAGDTSGNQAPPMTITGTGTAPTFGTGTGPVDGLSAVQLTADGQYLSSTLATGYVAIGAAYTLSAFIADGDLTGFQPTIVRLRAAVASQASISYSRGSVTFTTPGSAGFTNPGLAADNRTHSFKITYDGATTTKFYMDGVLLSTDAASTGPAQTAVAVEVQRTLGSGTATTGTVSHVAVHPAALTPTQVADIAGLGLSTLTEAGTARITRLAGYADIPVGTLDTSLTTVAAQATSGSGAFAAIQDATDAEGGLVFINGSGNLTFHSRSRQRSKTTPDLTLDHQWVTPDVQPVLDDQQLLNYFEVTATGTGGAQLARDTVSEADHGRYSDSKTYTLSTDQEALDRANWDVSKLSEPFPRYGTLTINLYGMTASMASTVLAALDLNCWLRVTSMSAQTLGGTTADVVVEGWQEQTTAESWTINCNVVARHLFESLVLDDATFGALDSYPISY